MVARERFATIALAGGIALLLSLPFVLGLQADSYKALYDGRWIAHHGIPHHEALTVMAQGRASIDERWLAGLLFSSWLIGGFATVAGLALGAVAAAAMILAALMLRGGASSRTTVLCCATAVLCMSAWQFIRAQDLALPLFAALLAICVIDSTRAQPNLRRLALLIPVLVIWADVHGSVLLGALLACSYLLYRAAVAGRDAAGAGRDAAAPPGLGVAARRLPVCCWPAYAS